MLRGLISPRECPLFGVKCFPDNPIGPCMVRIEGSCNIEFKYLKNKYKDTIQKDYNRETTKISKIISKSSAENLENFYFQRLEDFMKILTEDQNIIYSFIKDSNNNIVTNYKNEKNTISFMCYFYYCM